jgi:8-oxo-dGTP pyrophosphatase MutT (NUDIX family)
MTLLATLNPENATEEEVAKYRTREAARAIVFDEEGLIGILHVTKEKYHKLPGGGIEAGENVEQALRRECREELGCEIEIGDELGQVIEYRKMFNLKQTSFVYLAKLVGDKGQPNFMEDEITDGFEVQWVTLDEAIQTLASDQALCDEGRLYMVPRDRILLATAKANISIIK